MKKIYLAVFYALILLLTNTQDIISENNSEIAEAIRLSEESLRQENLALEREASELDQALKASQAEKERIEQAQAKERTDLAQAIELSKAKQIKPKLEQEIKNRAINKESQISANKAKAINEIEKAADLASLASTLAAQAASKIARKPGLNLEISSSLSEASSRARHAASKVKSNNNNLRRTVRSQDLGKIINAAIKAERSIIDALNIAQEVTNEIEKVENSLEVQKANSAIARAINTIYQDIFSKSA